MVPGLSIAWMLVSLFVSFGLPLGLLIVLQRRFRASLMPALAGALIFVAFAMVFESSIGSALLVASPGLQSAVSSGGAAYGLYAGLMAGLFEETGRLCAFLFLTQSARGKNDVSTALSYGVGHGGIESILLVGMTYLSNLMVSISVNQHGVDALLDASGLDAAAREIQRGMIEVLVNTPSFDFLAGGIERIITIAVHIALSVLVWMAVTRRGSLWMYPLAILLHAALNFPAGLYRFGIIRSAWLIELVVLLIGAGICLLTCRLYRGPRAVRPAEG